MNEAVQDEMSPTNWRDQISGTPWEQDVVRAEEILSERHGRRAAPINAVLWGGMELTPVSAGQLWATYRQALETDSFDAKYQQILRGLGVSEDATGKEMALGEKGIYLRIAGVLEPFILNDEEMMTVVGAAEEVMSKSRSNRERHKEALKRGPLSRQDLKMLYLDWVEQ